MAAATALGGLRAAARWALLLGSLFAVGFASWEYRHRSLPSPVPRTAPLHEFSEERARDVLERLVALGPRELGSPALEHASQVIIAILALRFFFSFVCRGP